MGRMNQNRAAWAAQALTAFKAVTGADPGDALADLLADLMHLAHEEEADFEAELARARTNYDAEIIENE